MKLIKFVVVFLFLSAFSDTLFAQRVVRIGANSRDAETVKVQSGVFVICVSKDSSIVPLTKLLYANDSILFLRDSSVYIKDLDGLIVYRDGRFVTRIATATLLAVPTAIPLYVPLTEGTWIWYGFPVFTTIPFIVSTFNVFRKPKFYDLKTTSIALRLSSSDKEYAKSLMHYDYYQNRSQTSEIVKNFVAPRVYLVSKKSSKKTTSLILPQPVKLKTSSSLKIKGRLLHLTDSTLIVQRVMDTISIVTKDVDQIKVLNASHGWTYVCYGLSLNGAYNAIGYSESKVNNRYTLPLSIYSASLAILGYVISPKWKKMKDYKLTYKRE